MSFIYCSGCDWSQDDFYDLRLRKYSYNPLTKILTRIRVYWKPRIISYDSEAFDCGGLHWHKNGKSHPAYTFSWLMFMHEIRRAIRQAKNMKWWTRDSFIRSRKRGKAICPNCGATDKWVED